ncbi:MAG: hypothetical protein AB1630_11885, partial [bacterium]
ANYAINLGAKTPGGIGGVLDKLWDSLKDIFEKEGIERSQIENRIGERFKDQEIATKELYDALHPQIASPNPIIPPIDYQQLTDAMLKTAYVGGELKIEGNNLKVSFPNSLNPGQSTATFLGQNTAEGLLKFWKEEFLKVADMGISLVGLVPSPVKIGSDIYDVLSAIKGEGLAGKLSPLERLAIALPIIGTGHIKLVQTITKRGFKGSLELYHKITGGLQDIGRRLGKGDEITGIRGSVVTGRKYTIDRPFNADSDIDFFIVSDKLIKKYGLSKEGGKALLELNPGSKHPERLENLNKIPELKKWVEESQNVLGRKTPIAIWENEAFMKKVTPYPHIIYKK